MYARWAVCALLMIAPCAMQAHAQFPETDATVPLGEAQGIIDAREQTNVELSVSDATEGLEMPLLSPSQLPAHVRLDVYPEEYQSQYPGAASWGLLTIDVDLNEHRSDQNWREILNVRYPVDLSGQEAIFSSCLSHAGAIFGLPPTFGCDQTFRSAVLALIALGYTDISRLGMVGQTSFDPPTTIILHHKPVRSPVDLAELNIARDDILAFAEEAAALNPSNEDN